MSVYRDKERGRFLFEFSRYIGGKRVRTRKLLPAKWTQAEADTFDRQESARLYGVAQGITKPERTIEEAVACYLEHKTGLKSFKNIERELLGMWPSFAGKPLSALPDVCREFAAAALGERDTPISPATIRNRIRYLSAACKYAWKVHKVGDHNPTERVSVPSVNNERQFYASRAEMLLIAGACTNRNARMAIRIAFYSGMRLSEILRAKVRGDCWILEDTKNGSPRLVPIHPRAAVCARRFRTAPKITVQRNWEKARARTGFDHLHFHDLRHSAASELIAQDVDLFTVGRILGHKDARSTARYSHLAVGKMAEAIGRMGRKSPTTPSRKAA